MASHPRDSNPTPAWDARIAAAGEAVIAFTRAMPLFATVLYVSAVSIPLMLFADKPLALWIKHGLDPHVFGFFKTITDFGLGGHWYLLFVGMALLCWALSSLSHTVEGHELWKGRIEPWLYALSVMIASGIGVQLLKFAFGRYRPKFLFSDGIYGFAPFSGNNSFPSGHSQNIWAAMMSLWFIFPRYRPVWVAIGVLISLSRVFTTVHFLSDVIMGGTIAILTAIWFKQLFDASHKRGAVEWQ
jgi:membrane-associated phospholipid phosphatase